MSETATDKSTTRKSRAPKTISDIDAAMEALRSQRETMINERSAAMAKLIAASGLAELDIKDSELKAEFEAIVARFRR